MTNERRRRNPVLEVRIRILEVVGPDHDRIGGFFENCQKRVLFEKKKTHLFYHDQGQKLDKISPNHVFTGPPIKLS